MARFEREDSKEKIRKRRFERRIVSGSFKRELCTVRGFEKCWPQWGSAMMPNSGLQNLNFGCLDLAASELISKSG